MQNRRKKEKDPDKQPASISLVPLTVLFSEPFLTDLELLWKLHKTIKPNLF